VAEIGPRMAYGRHFRAIARAYGIRYAVTMKTVKSFKVASSRIENGQELCNTCVRPVSNPYRYRTDKGTRGCIASCHDQFVQYSTDADWVSNKRYRLPKWIAEARRAIGPMFERAL
jgi:hypothetical protein